MSITDAIKDMEKHMGTDFSDYMNAPLPHNGQAYIQRDYKTGIEWVMCPFCAKRQFPLTTGAHITGQKFKCKGSGCKKIKEEPSGRLPDVARGPRPLRHSHAAVLSKSQRMTVSFRNVIADRKRRNYEEKKE